MVMQWQATCVGVHARASSFPAAGPTQVFVGSALNKDGVQQLKAWAVEQLPLGPTLYNKVRGWSAGLLA